MFQSLRVERLGRFALAVFSLLRLLLAVLKYPFQRLQKAVSQPGNEPILQRPPNNDGPPDLDDLWRDFSGQIRRLFGKKDPPRGNDPFQNRPPRNTPNMPSGPAMRNGLLLLVGVIVLLWAATGFFTVKEGYQAVILQFGRFHQITDAGLRWRLPYPIQTVEVVKISDLRSVLIGRGTVEKKDTGLRDSSMLTEDTNIVDISFAVQYRLKADGAKDFLFNNVNPDESVVQASEAAVREIVGRSKMDYVLYEGREKVANDLQALIQSTLDRYKTGILVTSVALQNVQVPDPVRDAFEDTQRAGQDRERLINEGRAYENDIIPKAQGTASRLLAEAEGYRTQVVERAKGDSARFGALLNSYKKAPRVTRDRLYIDAMKEALKGVDKVIVDSRNNSQLLYLPLDKLMQQSTQNQAASQSQPAPAPNPISESVRKGAAAIPAREVDARDMLNR